jgi:hypothetical protein
LDDREPDLDLVEPANWGSAPILSQQRGAVLAAVVFIQPTELTDDVDIILE